LATVIRLRRMGTKKRPSYRFVSTDSRSPRDGRFVEILGYYNPIVKPALVKIDEEKMTYWLDKGAQPSETVRSLLTQVGFYEKYLKAQKGEDVSGITISETITERKKRRKKTKASQVEEVKPEAPQAEAPAEAPKAEEPKSEAPKAEEPKAEQPKAEEPKAEEPKSEEPKAEE